MSKFIVAIIWGLALVATVQAQPARFQIKPSEEQEALMVISNINRPSLAFRAAVIPRMLEEANFFSDRLKLPTPHPIQITDIQYPYVSPPWFSVVTAPNFHFYPDTIFTTNIFNPAIAREQRLSAIKIGVSGAIETTNFLFSFKPGRIWEVERLSEHEVEYYAKDLDKLIGQPSLINDSEAHEMATKWLAAIDIDVPALEKKYPPEVNRLRYLSKGSTNVIELPFYFVHWGWQYFTNNDDNHTISSTPLVEVKILGTTKEFVELHILDTSFSRRPLLLVTNALELIRTPNPTVKHLQPNPMQNNSVGDTNAPVARPPTF
jgi:hypothetical protein